MPLASRSSPFALIMSTIRNRVVSGLGLADGFVRIVASDEYKVTRNDPMFCYLRPFAPVPIEPQTGQSFGDIGSGRLSRDIARIIRAYIWTRSGEDIYGDDKVGLLSLTPSDTVLSLPVDTPIRHFLAEELLVNTLDDYLPVISNRALTLGPLHWVSTEGGPPLRKAENSEGLIWSALDFQVVYIHSIDRREPATA